MLAVRVWCVGWWGVDLVLECVEGLVVELEAELGFSVVTECVCVWEGCGLG